MHSPFGLFTVYCAVEKRYAGRKEEGTTTYGTILIAHSYLEATR
jgi:hypothetical protein